MQRLDLRRRVPSATRGAALSRTLLARDGASATKCIARTSSRGAAFGDACCAATAASSSRDAALELARERVGALQRLGQLAQTPNMIAQLSSDSTRA